MKLGWNAPSGDMVQNVPSTIDNCKKDLLNAIRTGYENI